MKLLLMYYFLEMNNEEIAKTEYFQKRCIPKSAQLIGTYEKITKGETVKMKQILKKPSYYLLSQAMDGDEKRLKRYWHFMTRTYQSAVCVHSMMNTAMSILL